jgi:hypothetical protein
MSRSVAVGDTVAPVTSPARPPIADDLEIGTELAGRTRRSFEPTRHANRVVARLTIWWRTRSALDPLICLLYVAFAFWFTQEMWPDPATNAIADNVPDQALIEWFLAQGVLFWRGQFSLVTPRLNAPDGVNLMSNASHILHGIIMAPVTAAFGAPVSFALLVALNLAATAAGWYLLLRRSLGLRRWAAAIGGAFTGFAPGMISQSHSHLHITAQWLVPLIVYLVIRLTRATTNRDAVLTGAWLGAALFGQVLLGEEVLLLTTLTVGLFGLAYAARQRAWARSIARRFLLGAGAAAVVAGVLLAYPLWVQFHGRQHTPNAPFAPAYFYADVASYPVFSPLSWAGSLSTGGLATSSAEYNAYLGLPILLVAVGLIIWRWREPFVTAVASTAVIMTWLSFGPSVTLNHQHIPVPSLYNLLSKVPIVNAALPTRYSLALIPLIAVLLAYGLDTAARSHRAARYIVPVAVIAAIIPMIPTPLDTTARAPVPQFISSGDWRQCTPDGGVLVPVPLPTPQQPDVMRWAAAADDAFALPEGFFIGPYGPNGISSIGKYPTGTSILLAQVSTSGVVPQITDGIRAQARADLAYWKADCVALAQAPNEDALHSTLDQLLGPGRPIDDAWIWKISR